MLTCKYYNSGHDVVEYNELIIKIAQTGYVYVFEAKAHSH